VQGGRKGEVCWYSLSAVSGVVNLPSVRRHDGGRDDYQKEVDGFWACSANSRHATN
jgi:hypothetical protein